jgi:hypothetical protein
VVENYGPVQQLARVVLNPHDGELHHSSSMCVCMLQMMFTIISSKKIEAGSYGSCRSETLTEREGVSSESY